MSAPKSQPPQKHAALRWLIRGTGAVIAIPAALLAFFAVVLIPILMIVNPRHQVLGGWMLALVVSIMLTGGFFYGAIAKIGYDMFRRVSTTTIANFAFIFSLLTAYALYHLLPLNLPKFLADHVGKDAPFFGQSADHGISYRATLAFIAFFIFYRVINNYFLRALNLIAPISPPPPDQNIPEYPQKSPLIPL